MASLYRLLLLVFLNSHCDGGVVKRFVLPAPNVPVVSSPADCITVPNGNYPHPSDCTKFINCHNGTGGEIMCPRYLHFNETSKRCDFHPENAGCSSAVVFGNITRPAPGEPVNCPKLFNGNYAHPSDCSKFISCSNGHKFELNCTRSHHYKASSNRCESPANAACSILPTTPGGQANCSGATDGDYAHPTDCSMFVTCTNGQRIKKSCPGNLRFDINRRLCDFSSKAFCQGVRPMPPLKTKLPDGSTDCSRVKNGDYGHPTNCSRFITCSNGLTHIKNCPRGLRFDIVTRMCETPDFANCSSAKKPTNPPLPGGPVDCSSSPDADYAHPTNCNMFVTCSNGLPYERNCSIPTLHFDINSRECKSPFNATCGSLTTTAAPMTSPVPNQGPDCKKDGTYRNPSNCSTFIHCSHGIPHEKSCPPGLHFNAEKSWCDWPRNVNCNGN